MVGHMRLSWLFSGNLPAMFDFLSILYDVQSNFLDGNEISNKMNKASPCALAWTRNQMLICLKF